MRWGGPSPSLLLFLPFPILWAPVVCLLVWGCGEAPVNEAPALQDYGELGGDFALTDQDGRPFQQAQLRGRAVLLFFGYTHCPDFCPLTLSKLTRVFELLGERRERVRAVFVSVDPERDSPEKLKEYLEYFAVGVIGLTGSQARVDSVARQYGVAHQRRESDSAAGYFVDHSTYTFLIDFQGKIRYIFKHGDTPELMAAGVERLLEE